MSRESKHTPGEWKAEIARHSPDSEPFGMSVTVAGKALPIASAGVYAGHRVLVMDAEWRASHPESSQHFTPEEVIANAHLIAAAPDLLAFAKAYLRGALSLYDCDQMARAAIAKAEGNL